MELNPELEFVVTVDDRPFSVDEGETREVFFCERNFLYLNDQKWKKFALILRINALIFISSTCTFMFIFISRSLSYSILEIPIKGIVLKFAQEIINVNKTLFLRQVGFC